MLKILITGGTGFVGKELIAQLRDNIQVEIIRIVRNSNEVISDHDIVVSSIDAKTDWSGILDKIDVIIHLAAKVHDMNYKDNDDLNNEYYQINTEGTKKLVEDASKFGVGKIIFLSTIKVNGEGGGNIIFKEIDTPKPQGSYAKSKFIAEQYIISNSAKAGLKFVIIRPTLIIGANVKGNLLNLMKLVSRNMPIPLSKHDNKRSVIGLKNLCDFIIYCITNEDCNNNTFILSEQNTISTRELFEKIAYYMKRKILIINIPTIILRFLRKIKRFDDIYIRAYGDLVASKDKLIKNTGWKYKYSIDEQIESMVNEFIGNFSENEFNKKL